MNDKFHGISVASSFTNASLKLYDTSVALLNPLKKVATRKNILFNVFLIIIATSTSHLPLHS